MVRNQRGDTLVEVLMAIVIISVVIVGAITMMNRGLAAAQIALEHSQVRLSVSSQVEMLRYARDKYLQSPADPNAVSWSAIVAATDQQPITYDDGCDISGTKQAFYLTNSSGSIARNNYTPTQPATVALPGQGLWIESVISPPGITPAYIDFVVRACWQASGSAGTQRTVTAVRLYDPSR